MIDHENREGCRIDQEIREGCRIDQGYCDGCRIDQEIREGCINIGSTQSGTHGSRNTLL